MKSKIIPDFTRPPIDRLLLGVGYTPIPELHITDVSKISGLFKDDFSKIANNNLANNSYTPQNFAIPSYGFMFNVPELSYASSNTELCANFGRNSFSISWDKSDKNSIYPRFENIYQYFEKYLNKVQEFLVNDYSHEIKVQGYNIGYYNAILVKDYKEFQNWFEIAINENFNFEQLNIGFTKSFSDPVNGVFAEMENYISSATSTTTQQKAILFGFTFSGNLEKSHCQSVKEFFDFGRIEIAKCFKTITTNFAQESWR